MRHCLNDNKKIQRQKKVNWNFLLLEHWVKSWRTLYFMQLEFVVGGVERVGDREKEKGMGGGGCGGQDCICTVLNNSCA